MKGNRELDELFISYLLNELNEEEKAFVEELINSVDKNREYFESLQNTWRLLALKQELDKIDSNVEWLHFKQGRAREKQKLIAVKQEQALPEIHEEVEEYVRRFSGRKILVALALAVSLITLVVFTWNFSEGGLQIKKPVSAVKAVMPVSINVLVKHEVNTSGKPKELLLSDGSLIALSNNSEIIYQQPFTGNKREIVLKGKADFSVAKDSAKPFTVYSLALAITALGTRFTVTAFEHDENIIVRLHEGKIVVKSIASVSTKLKSDYYLFPGQQLIYNNKKFTARLLRFTDKKPDLQDYDKSETFTDDIVIPENYKGSWYMFNNQSLEQVLDQLKILYNTDIVYAKKDVRNRYFIGRFDKSDSLYNILFQIASLNNFKVTKKDNRFFITR